MNTAIQFAERIKESMKNFNYHIPTDIYFGKGKIRVLGDKISAIGQNLSLIHICLPLPILLIWAG